MPAEGPAASRGRRLVFLVSQPRAGSTLLQRILARHPEVGTHSEPWLMLPPLYALRQDGWAAEYGARWSRAATDAFLSALPDGRLDYQEGARRMYGHLYSRMLETTGKRLFLDKTPRYYLILRELAAVFPEARIILLLRHPGAVLDSVLRSWVGRDRRTLRRFTIDLFRGPEHLAEALAGPPRTLRAVRFEELVEAPVETVRQLCQWLGLEFHPAMLAARGAVEEDWTLGDQGDRPHGPPDAEAAHRWLDSLADVQRWRDSRDYLEALGDELVAALGYDADHWRQRLAAARPAWPRRLLTRQLPRHRRDGWRLPEAPASLPRRLAGAVRRDGWRGAAVKALDRLRDGR